MTTRDRPGGPTRRAVLGGLGAAAALAGCATSGPRAPLVQRSGLTDGGTGDYRLMYAETADEGYVIPAVDVARVDPKYLRQTVPDPTGAPAGSVVIDTANRFAYLAHGDGTATRYGVGIGRAGFAWSGRARVQARRRWPTWTPPAEMVARDRDLKRFAGGMPPGPANPLGARALYLYEGGRDTLYRLHGTPEWWTIGRAVSSGCVRFMNHDIVDLYDRVADGAGVRVVAGALAA